MRRSLLLLLSFLLGCSDESADYKKTSLDTLSGSDTLIASAVTPDIRTVKQKFLSSISSFPLIADTAAFIQQLKILGDFSGCWGPEREAPRERISYYKKVKLNGSKRDYLFVEYDYGSGAMVCFPFKYQFLFTPEGKLIATFEALRFKWLQIFPNQNPYLLTLTSTSRGNGGHRLYKVSSDSVENVYEGYTDYQVQTYDAGEDLAVYEPEELNLSTKDIDKDGYNDLAFSGKLVLVQGLTKDSIWYDYEVSGTDTISYSIDHPFKKLPIKYVFLYDAKSGHFKRSPKYSHDNPFDK